jgi:hypothetical protein
VFVCLILCARTILHPIPCPPTPVHAELRVLNPTPRPQLTSAANKAPSLYTTSPSSVEHSHHLPGHSALSVTRLKTAFVILAHPSSIYARNNVILAEDGMDAQAAPCGGKGTGLLRSFVRSFVHQRTVAVAAEHGMGHAEDQPALPP